jgi:plasmid maintenance system antidote protein VapI
LHENPISYFQLKSFLTPEAVSFGVLQARLIGFLNNRISNGDFSERGLARILRISQPQIHNVLKGARKLTPELADRLLACFGMTVLDLLGTSELNAHLSQRDEQGKTQNENQAHIAPHVGIQRFTPGPEIPKKGPNRQLSRDESDINKTA